MRMGFKARHLTAVLLCPLPVRPRPGDDAAETWSLHGQMTLVDQYHPAFRAPSAVPTVWMAGAGAMKPSTRPCLRAFACGRAARPISKSGNRPGVSASADTLAFRVFPAERPTRSGGLFSYFPACNACSFARVSIWAAMPRILNRPPTSLAARGRRTISVLTAGEDFPVTDIFDTNSYAHDPRGDYLNWPPDRFPAPIDLCRRSLAMRAMALRVSGRRPGGGVTLRAGLFDLSRQAQ